MVKISQTLWRAEVLWTPAPCITRPECLTPLVRASSTSNQIQGKLKALKICCHECHSVLHHISNSEFRTTFIQERSSGVNHFQAVPALPGAQPLTIAGGRQAKTKKGKGRGSNKGKSTGDDKSPQRSKRSRGDDELLQLDLKRKSHLLSQNVVPRRHYVGQ